MADSKDSVRGEHHPDPSLLFYYVLTSLVLGPFFFLLLVPRIFRYRTLRYNFDDEGVTMRWGALFRREISLTYPRIQDIHLTSSFVERWLGLARIQVQTAAGSATAEMTIEGLKGFEEIRNFLYSKMRGAKGKPAAPPVPAPEVAAQDEVTAALREVVSELRALRRDLQPTESSSPGPEGSS